MKLHFKYSSRLDQYAQTAMTDANSAQHSKEIFAINKKKKEKKGRRQEQENQRNKQPSVWYATVHREIIHYAKYICFK